MDIKIPTVAEVKQIIIQKYGAEDKDGYIEKIFENVAGDGPIIRDMLNAKIRVRQFITVCNDCSDIEVLGEIHSEIFSILCSINVDGILSQKDMKIKALEERVAQLEMELKQKQE